MSVDSKRFGQKRPPLSVTIKGILERYPDGQIFKEMIQNADDAGAKTVWFYVDARQHGTSKLPHADLRRFQGPALVSANDACFTDKDWEGIQSLQQSVKADDPFKVGRFGIGFNSVYHLTDLPIIVSGNRLACFEPQEVMWKGESGQSFKLTDLLRNSSDIVAPLKGLAEFNARGISKRHKYPHTLFRLPLRKQASGLSENVYTIQRVHELLDALREEAKFLLLFLKSVDKIEVINVLDTGHHSLHFRVEVNSDDKAAFCSDRETFMRDLHTTYERDGFKISQIISYSAKFSVVVTNPTKNHRGTSEWIVSNCVGSPEASVQTAAEKQKIFPWVGAAVELKRPNASGRIFCFLPMPAETSSGLPVHVHGTFGLNDERRTLKWPGIEQRNDPMANWNKILVSQLLPGCYVKLLQQLKGYVSPNIFYEAWPKVAVSEVSQFAEMLQPLFSSLFSQATIWTEKTEALQHVGEWISVSSGNFISEGSTLPSVVQQTLSKCGVKLVTVPNNVWAAIRFNKIKVSVVSPQLACNKFQRFPRSYSNIDPIGKREILRYCLKDNIVHHNDLGGLNLLPLANGTFTNFDQGSCVDRQLVYLCNSNFPKSLLPNLDNMLVDINDMELQSSLSKVASSQKTKLRQLETKEVASLLPQAMPQEWKGQSMVVMPNGNFSTSWLKSFWKWLRNKDLKLFNNKLIVPVYQSTLNNTDSFYLSRLSLNSSIVYKDTSQFISCSSSLLSTLYRMKVMVCLQNEFSFVKHPQLSQYVKDFDANGVLDAIGHQSNYTRAVFSRKEAKNLREFLSRIDLPSSLTKTVLNNLSIFNSASDSSSQLYSIASAESQSLAKAALVEPSSSLISVKNVPHNLILFSRRDYNQIILLQKLEVIFPTDVDLLLNYIFPSIHSQLFPGDLVDGLMTEVIDSFQTLKAKCSHLLNLSEAIGSLPFLKTLTESRKSPQDLYDPTNEEVKALYEGEDVFPSAPFEMTQRVQVLKQCGLRDTVQPQEVLDIIKSISTAFSSQPVLVSSTRLKRAKAILKYVSKMVKARLSSVAENLYTLATTRNWLPVMSNIPQNYPCQLPWKGSKYKCHLVSLSSSVAVTSTHTCSTLPYLVGTQMFVTEPLVDLKVAKILHTDWGQFVVPHFKRLKQLKEELTPDDLEFLVHKVYSFLNVSTAHIEQIYSIEKWIFLRKQKQFVSPAVVALQYNDKFPQDLQPYVHILPDTLLKYKELFGPTSQVSSTVTRAQILSVLGRIREEVRAGVHRYREEEGPIIVILNWLTNNGTKEVAGETNVLVPIESDSKWPQLVKASKVVYTDNDFLKTFLQKSDKDSSHTFVHNIVDPRLARCLGVVPLSEFLDISEDTFADAGQYEPLAVRLRNILQEYKDGLTIIKELLQNADDAEATEVNICYDSRQHEQNRKRLFFSGMADAHGPALIVQNNKTLSDDDFTNITKLAGATKQEKHFKIGKFGIGFCSVYHMTDVPSFVSRDKLYIFDPTLSYLKKEIKNPSQPGKKTTYTNKFIAKSGQLSPYDGLFGFERSRPYKGTMFRFPFRTSASELSGVCYSGRSVDDLIRDIQKCASSLLLFLQHVKCLTFHRIEKGKTSPSVVLRVTKDCIHLPFALNLPDGVEVKKLSSYHKASKKTSHQQWLVSQFQQSQQCEDMLNSPINFSTASVACLLIDTGTTPTCYKTEPSFNGEIFCFLPLSQETGLPVHVSSNFAVVNNRRGIWISDDPTSQKDEEVSWNVSLMKTVIPMAYHGLLVALKNMAMNGVLQDYTFYSLWPLTNMLKEHNPWENMVNDLYRLISDSNLLRSHYSGKWLKLSESKFLKPKILCLSSDKTVDSLDCVVRVLQTLDLPMVYLPSKYGTVLDLVPNMINEETFITLFFKNLTILKEILRDRNKVIERMLEVYASEKDDKTNRSLTLKRFIKGSPCIPCTPDGTILKCCNEVVDPHAHFAQLFDDEEHYFPITELGERVLARTALISLGMIDMFIPWDMLIERAHTINKLYSSNRFKALTRVKTILASKTSRKEPSHAKSLATISFLPVMKESSTKYYLPWKGDECSADLMCGKKLCKSNRSTNIMLAGSQIAFVCENSPRNGGCGPICSEMVDVLQIRKCPTVTNVVQHLIELIQLLSSQTNPEHHLISWTAKSCQHIYDFLNERIEFAHRKKKETPDLAALTDIPWIWSENEFVTSKVVSKKWKLPGPFLYHLPPILSRNDTLINALNVKQEFDFSDIKNALKEMKKNFGDSPVDDTCMEIIRELLPSLSKIESPSTIILPDEDFVLHYSNRLSYNDAPWAPKDEQYTYVNNIITRDLAITLCVSPVRYRMLEGFASDACFGGIPFGQHEELTQRIQNILRDYPFDITVLKELLQNADDAKATKMYFILDKRTHGSTSVISENWTNLQGPALLVWNDSEFSKEDMDGIQKLGLGSKRSDSETIGQYGIGFNVVYHLTDCPSFITGGKHMCIFDPHCSYVPGASVSNPGMKYDLKKDNFWHRFPDMKSAYLQSSLKDGSPDFSKGSLFRFPLRCTPTLAKNSKIMVKSDIGDPDTLTAKQMQQKLIEWSLDMKHALFFVNHVRELQFFVIENGTHVLFKQKHFETYVNECGLKGRESLYKKFSEFNDTTGNRSCITSYPLTICDIAQYSTAVSKREEKWLIQQGVGDIENNHQSWEYTGKVKPRHGIAVPLEQKSAECSTKHRQEEKFSGQVFCFLPLPLQSKLPVHVNGQFFLHTNRRDLWKPTTPGTQDKPTNWNESLFKALASSYAHLLVEAQPYLIPAHSFTNLQEAKEIVKHYYEVFPNACPLKLEQPYLDFAKNMYKILIKLNSKVLAVINGTNSGSTLSSQESARFHIQWHPIRNISNPSSQIYFLAKDANVKPILESIGMKVTVAPSQIRTYLNEALGEKQLKNTTSKNVYSYYTSFSYQASHDRRFPCKINKTVFENVDKFKIFLQCLLEPSEENPKIFQFPKSPLNHPLLLTADETLSKFSCEKRVIMSEYSHLFPQSQDKFLHPNLIDIEFTTDYFICVPSLTSCNTNIKDLQEFHFIYDVFLKELPISLRSSETCTDYNKHISKTKLKEFWDCLLNDPLFEHFQSTLTKHLALLPSKDGQLFSTASDILPIYPPQPNQDLNSLPNQGDTVYQVLVDLKLPFLETDLISYAEVDCPSLKDHKKVLEILHHLYCSKDIPQISNNWEVIKKLISYFKNINFETNRSSCEHIRSLPLFENNDGTFISLEGKMSFIWPMEVCVIGWEKWLPLYDVVFLKPDGDWKRLGSMNELNIKNISVKEVYTTYIFKAFSVLNESERYKHLDHIRTSTLHVVSEQANSDDHRFVTALKDLPCIGGDDEILKRVCEFCNHKKEVFITFSDEYQFLPLHFKESSKESSWLKFFKHVGLKATLSKEEYLHLCKCTSRGQHVSPSKASAALVTYLFSGQRTISEWYNDQQFLQNVSDIPFLCTKSLPDLTWICPAAQTCNKIMSHNEQIHMTKFKEAAVSEEDTLIWTVKPIVSLKMHDPSKFKKLLQNLQVIQNPDVSHVIQNITNISRKSKFADQKLFHNFSDSLMTITEGVSLTTAMSNQFAFLASKMDSLDESNYKGLRSLSCVPVPASLPVVRTWQVVLMKPTTVVMREPDLKEFHPCIHSLPSQLCPSERLLLKIGVAESLQLTHIQIVLEASFKASDGQEPEPNTKCRVIAAVKRLHKLLEELPKENGRDGLIENSLSPLYLPARDKTLANSTSLLYADNPSYRGCTQLNLSEIDFKELDIDQSLFGFQDSSLCNLLPEAVRPVGLSKICRHRVNENCKQMEDSKLAKKLKETLTLRTLSKACLMAMKTHALGKEISKSVEPIIVDFINDISNSVTTVEKLQTVVCLKDSGKEIGNSSKTYFMEREMTDSCTSYKLFLDSLCNDDPVEIISDHLLEILTDCQPNMEDVQLFKKIKPLLVKILKADSNDKIKMILVRYCISLDDNEMDKCEFVIGEHIPTCWHHRLDQDINHVFHSGEKVGFDKDESVMIYAEILYPILTEGCCSFDSVPNLEMKYNIIVSTDGECCEASVLDLYKFILSSAQEDVPETEQEITDLVPHEESDTSQLRDHLKHENEEMIKRELMKLLDEIMKLTETNRRKAIHRLYLKWHPDKNLNNPELAETIFKFLLAEIEHRECSSSLQKEQWEKAAKEHGFYWKFEHSNKNSGRNRRPKKKKKKRRRSGGESSRGDGTGSILIRYPPFNSDGSDPSEAGWEEHRPIPERYIPPFDKEDFQIRSNPREGRRWLRQAKVELIALETLCDQLDVKPNLSCCICFAAHQVAEKALKAGKYYVCGLTVDALRIHDLVTHASGLQHERPIEAVGLVDKASSLNDYYLRTRYPDCWKPPTIPADRFTAEKALAARRNAKAILEIIQRILV